VLLLFTAAGWAAGTATGTAPAVPRPAPSKSAAKQTRSDADIEKDIRARFAKSKISADKFQVHVQGGVANIEGKTNVLQHKGVATRLAKSGGAVAVSNHIEVSDAAKEKAAENLETGRRRAQVTRGEPRSETASTQKNH
jgi:hypothetical protein